MSQLPGGAISNRPLRFYWVLDVSGSMSGTKIGELNYALREGVDAMKEEALNNPHAAVELKVMTFGSGFTWVTPAPVPLESFTWTDVRVSGITDMGAAMKAMASELTVGNMPERSLPPVVVLVTDGQPTDDFESGLEALMHEPWARKAVRIGIGIGGDADLSTLRKFIGHAEIEPLSASNPKDLVNFVRWVSTQVLKAASAPASQSSGMASAIKPMDVVPPPPPADADADDVW
jgi:uncharacterized protein YegL